MSYFRFLKSNLRWLAGGFLLTLFSSFGQTFFIALSTGEIRQAFDLTSGEYGSIFMVATLASALVLPILGQIVDRFSIVRVVFVTTIMLSLACIFLARADSVWLLLLALFTLRLFGQGMMTHIALTAMGRWYEENRGKAVSIASLGFNAGLAIFPVGFVIISMAVGWRNAWLIAAVIMLVIALPAISTLMRVERLPQSMAIDGNHNNIRQWTRNEMLRDSLFWLTTIGVFGAAVHQHRDFFSSRLYVEL